MDWLTSAIYEKRAAKILDKVGKQFPAVPSLRFTEPKYPSTAVILEIPGVCQVATYTCGITSTWSIIRALGVEISLREWSRICHRAGCRPDVGMSIDHISRALKKVGLTVKTHPYKGKRQVISWINDGQPILFGQGRDEDGHWMYVYGYSPRYVFVGNEANLLYPIRSKLKWGWKKFETELNPRELYIINTSPNHASRGVRTRRPPEKISRIEKR